jgi:hypothetical protein
MADKSFDLPNAMDLRGRIVQSSLEYNARIRTKRELFDFRANGLCDVYKEYMRECIRVAIERLEIKSPYRFHHNAPKVLLNFDQNHILTFSGAHTQAHNVHYGNRRMSGCWSERVPFVQNRNPFRELQLELAESNYYLLDESDHNKSLIMHIFLYVGEKPIDPPDVKLWHNFNTLPNS